MDLRTLRYFQVVAECGSYSRGAEMLCISQPAVSRAIQQLESELGQALFNRHGHGVSLTEAGEKLIDHTRTILHQVADARSDVERTGKSLGGTLRIALPSAVGAYLAPLLVERMARECPGTNLEFIGGYSAYIHERLVREQVDIACLHDPQPQKGFQFRPLMREEVFLVGRADLLPKIGVATITELARLSLILPSGANASRRVLTAWSAAENLWMKPVLTVDDHLILRGLLRAGTGLSLLTQGAFIEDQRAGLLRSIPLSPAVYWTLCMVSPRRAAAQDQAQRCMSILVELINERIQMGLGLPCPDAPVQRLRAV
jgi:LysR family nitrogen assimilation transcriptional regulator